MTQQATTAEVNTSTISYLIKNYAGYNLWANATLINWLRTKPEALLEKEIPSSFNSIKATVVHIWNTQRYWLSVLKRTEADGFEPFTGTLEEALSNWLEQSEIMANYVTSMEGETIEETNLVVSPWFQCDFQNFEYIMQCMNHSTYHRGQIVTIGRNLGFTDAPMTDYNFYNIHGK
jgi:uncharacterized damage-inducible protein DinB